tara:strand:- start:209 stop:733 length:525 start_codon:yes stop_codon:yes gene_type:complete
MKALSSLIKNNFLTETCFILMLLFCFSFTVKADTEIIKKLGDAYVIYLPGSAKLNDIVKHLESEISGENWQVVSEMDVGAVVDELGVVVENRVLSVCKIEYLARAIKDDPFISLIIPCRFTVFREQINDSDSRIVVGFYDPVAEAQALDLKHAKAAEIASKELKEILLNVAEYY